MPDRFSFTKRFPPTPPAADAVLDALTDACRRQLARAAVAAVGIGMPGTVDEARGVLVRAANLPLADYPLTQALSRRLGIPAYLGNDANCALYGEIYAGAGRESDNFLLVTVGTGIGGGIRIGRKIHLGMESRAGEFGHMIVAMDGRPCRCGRVGCWEQYASATALCRMTREAAAAQPDSLLARQIREAGTSSTAGRFSSGAGRLPGCGRRSGDLREASVGGA